MGREHEVRKTVGYSTYDSSSTHDSSQKVLGCSISTSNWECAHIDQIEMREIKQKQYRKNASKRPPPAALRLLMLGKSTRGVYQVTGAFYGKIFDFCLPMGRHK